MSLEKFVEDALKDQEKEVEELLRIFDIMGDVLPSNAFYFTVQAICNEH